MKNIYSFITALLFSSIALAQAPQKMSYQAVLRNSSNVLITNTTVSMRISILQSNVTGTAVYVETHTPTTNSNGLVTLEIGNGTVVTGMFSAIDWASGPYFIKSETDPAGGTSYSITGTSELLSVPYALFSKTSETVITETDPTFDSSPAKNITTNDITNLSNLSGVNTGDQDGSETIVTGGAAVTVTGTGTTLDPYVVNSNTSDGSETIVTGGTDVTITGTGTVSDPYIVNAGSQIPAGTATGEMLYWNGTAWVIVEAGSDGDHMVFCNGRPVWGGCNLLTITKSGTGTGTILSNIAGINCGVDCQQYYSSGTTVLLTATADATSTFTGWSGGGCSGTGTCLVTMDNAKSVTATFATIQYTLTVSRTGTGTGTVTSAPAGINCGATCNTSYNINTTVTLTATPNATSTFTGWSGGGCSGTGVCVVTMNNAKSVTANFDVAQYNLNITRTGMGSGNVSSDIGTINCGTTCTNAYNAGTLVTLTATPSLGSTFTGWSGGGCSGTGNCTVTMNSSTTVSAAFGTAQYSLTILRTGTGSGTVTSNTGGINCGSTCSATFNYATLVTLTAASNATSTFTGWSGGGCSGTSPCTVTMDNAKSVTANFDRTQYTLTIARTGTGIGTVTSNPGTINCGATCSNVFDVGTFVTLNATPNATSNFTGWSGSGCTGTGACVVNMDNAKTVTANFTKKQYNLTITNSGNGTVTSSPGGINCGTTCTSPYEDGTVVLLTATPDPSYAFTGWSGGGCSGTGTCTVTMNAAKSVSATFTSTISQYNLNVSKTGTGGGFVSSDVGNINCGPACSDSYNENTVVTLTAAANGTSSFSGWSGAGCTGTGDCIVTMDNVKSVTATFDVIQYSLFIIRNGNGSGSVTSDIGGINCGPSCTGSYNVGTTVVLTANPGFGSSFTGWSGGGCSGTSPCPVTMDNVKSVTATFSNP